MALLYSPGIGFGFGFGSLLGEKVRLGYVFDSGIPESIIESSGSHELSISYFFRRNTSYDIDRVMSGDYKGISLKPAPNLDRKSPENKVSDSINTNLPYYVVAGSFDNKKSAKAFKKLLWEESGINTVLHEDINSNLYLIITSGATSISNGKEKIRSLLNKEKKGLIIKEPWIYKNNK